MACDTPSALTRLVGIHVHLRRGREELAATLAETVTAVDELQQMLDADEEGVEPE